MFIWIQVISVFCWPSSRLAGCDVLWTRSSLTAMATPPPSFFFLGLFAIQLYPVMGGGFPCVSVIANTVASAVSAALSRLVCFPFRLLALA